MAVILQPRCPIKHASGFTLLELLIVAVIISVTASLFVISVSFNSPEDDLKEETRRLYSLLKFAHDQSIIRSEEYGLRFNQQGYRFMTLDEDEKWIDVVEDRHLRERRLPENMRIELIIEKTEVELNDYEDENDLVSSEDEEIRKKIKPQVFLLSSSELTPEFVTRFRFAGIDKSFEIQANLNGKYELIDTDE